MATIVYLKPGEPMPADQNWVLVTRDLKGLFTVVGPTAEQGGQAYLVAAGLGLDLASAIERAGSIADGMGVETVLVETARAG